MRRSISVIYRSLSQLSLKKIFLVFQLGFSHPLFSLMGLWATIKAFGIAEQLFPKCSSTNGVGNAFRHALWTSLIMSYCCKISSPEKSKKYCLQMTNLHEELFPNEPLEKQMDLHNNQIGINLFFEMLPGIHRQFFETSFLVEKLLKKTETAVAVESSKDFIKNEMIYIKDDNH